MTRKADLAGTDPVSKPNRLIDETSTYLQQHAHNPVDWYPWGPEAIGRAKREDKPILLSVGYAACHWCHVMAHESFEDVATAQLMNKYFINVKVDREERTDLDEIYMKAVQMMTGHGGWPMTVILTPDLKPFYGGTYFPPEDRHGLPGFRKLLQALADAWQEQREEITQSSNELTAQICSLDKLAINPDSNQLLSETTIEQAVQKLTKLFDTRWGGFGNAPKFPHTFCLSLVTRYIHRHGQETLAKECQELLSTSLNRMAYGGIHDHLGGGFARYSVDRQWLIPHFEKMLYDNALLALVYLDGFLTFQVDYWQRVARDIFSFVLNELRTDGGAFYSSLDADSEGEEGKFYVWTEAELRNNLQPDEFSFVTKTFGVTERGNFEHHSNVLHLEHGSAESAELAGLTETEFWQKWEPIRLKLLTIRNKRPHPERDEKVLTSWNSLMITAFVSGYKALGETTYLDAAKEAANFILKNLTFDGRLLRTWGKGQAKLNGYLDDYAFFIQSLLELASVDPDSQWLLNAVRLTEEMLRLFGDDEAGGLFYTANDHEKLITRSKSFYDGAIPSGTSVAAQCLLHLSKLLGNLEYQRRAEQLLNLYMPYAVKVPDQFANLLCALDFHLAQGPQIVCLLDGKNKSKPDLGRPYVNTIHSRYQPNKVVLIDTIGEDGQHAQLVGSLRKELSAGIAILEGRGLQAGQTTVYVCQNFACDQPITNLDDLKNKIEKMSRRSDR